ncbi:MAG: ribonuclease BN [Cycloclasticus sp. symbiont of Poecilosclerida sp. M]|nr:MAG: ribonuclease BN [Cycloclasticus sp. symbiont of Poecilosclerida sp. M]
MAKGKAAIIVRIEGFLWPEEAQQSKQPLALLKVLRIIYATMLDLVGGELSLRAMSLVYTTLLSLVPLLALSFSVLKAMGAHNEIEPFLFQFLEPLGQQGIQIGENIIGFIDNIKVGVLGSVGLGLLIYTVLSLVQKIENAFNVIWQVEATRSIGERFSSYLSVILIGPVLIVSALGMTASMMNSSFVQYFMDIGPFGSLILLATKMLPYLMVMGVFAFIYMFVPNTKVRIVPALVGAVIAGFLWETSGLLFATFVVNSTKYTAIYSSFAVIIMLLIWLYISWLILLLGSNLAFYIQNPSSIRGAREGFEISNRVKERIALLLIQLVGTRHYHGQEPYTLADLVEKTSLSSRVVLYVLNKLLAKDLLLKGGDDSEAYVPAKAIESTTLAEVVIAARSAEEEHYLQAGSIVLPVELQTLTGLMDDSLSKVMAGKVVSDLVDK